MEIYASMIEYVDYSIGRVLEELEKEHKLDNTLVLFMSDNGANPKEPESYPGNTKEVIQERYDNQLETMETPTPSFHWEKPGPRCATRLIPFIK